MTLVERELAVAGEPTLSGTLSLPAKMSGREGTSSATVGYPAILFIHGSGPLDRNENTWFAKLNVFNTLAEELSKAGFASFRYDKRGKGKSKGSYMKAGLWDLVDDATRALRQLKSQHEIDPSHVFLLGDSEGCLIAPLLAQRESVAGMILLMAPADRIDTVVGYQSQMMQDAINSIKGLTGSIARFQIRVQYGTKNIPQATRKLLARIRESTKPVIRFRLGRVNAKWYREHMNINPKEIYSSVTCPVFVMNGSKDVQVRPEDAKTISELVKGPCEWRILEGMTHLLRKDLKEGPSILHYKKLVKEKIDPEIAQLIINWLQRNLNGPETRMARSDRLGASAPRTRTESLLLTAGRTRGIN